MSTKYYIYKNKSSMTISQEPISLRDVLSKNTFEIPLYQREFSWELEQVSDLYYDIDISHEKDGHFLGSLLLYSEDKKEAKEVIDGQQRLTTLFLLLFTIKKALENSNNSRAVEAISNVIYQRSTSLLITDTTDEPRLKTGKRDGKLFRAILKDEETDLHKDKRIKSHKLLLDVSENFLKEKISKLKNDQGINGLLVFANKVLAATFIIMTADKKEDKILLFKTLNARGIELSQSDLIKNELCKSLKGLTEDEAVDLWDDMREILEKGKANIDLFLFYFINSLEDSLNIRKGIEEETRNIKNDKETYPPVPEKYLFQVYEEKFKGISSTLDFLNELKISAEHYIQISSPPSKNIYLHGIKVLNTTKCFPLLLRGKKILSEKGFEKLTKAVECISFRHAMLRSDPKDLEKFYYTALTKLKSDKDLDSIVDDIKLHASMSPARQESFKIQFYSAVRSTAISKMILGRIVAYQHESIDLDSNDVWVEHIMPKTPKGEWLKLYKKDPELYKLSLEQLGNLTLFQNKKNIGAANRDFSVKKALYKESRLSITQDLGKYDTWDWDSIDERQKVLYETAKEIWKLD